MRVWEEMYGQDADGNRGQMMTFHELEDTQDERDQIAELLILKGYEADDTGGATVELDGIGIEVEIGDYSSEMSKLERTENGN